MRCLLKYQWVKLPRILANTIYGLRDRRLWFPHGRKHGAAIPLQDGGSAVIGADYIELLNIRAGQYQITKISPPSNFDYCDLDVNSQAVTAMESMIVTIIDSICHLLGYQTASHARGVLPYGLSQGAA